MKRSNIIIKAALTGILSISFFFSAIAEECFKINSESTSNVSLKYISQTENTTRVYAVFSVPADAKDAVLVNVPRSLYVTDGDVNYKLVNAYNIPIEDESMLEFAILEDDDLKLNFILEFEKFPMDGPFDIVDKASNQSPLNISSVRVDLSQKKDLDSKRFLASTTPAHCGQYYEEGAYTMYYIRNDVFVSCHSTYGDDNFTMYLSIVNNSDHGILFNTGKVSAKGHKPKGRDTVEVDMPLLSKNNYVSKVAWEDRNAAENASRSYALENAGSAVSFASIGLPWRSAEHTGMRVLGGLIQDIGNAAAKPYLAELDKTRAERTKNYLQSQSIKSGESHTGFIQFQRPKKVNDFLLTIHMDGYDFEFYSKISK